MRIPTLATHAGQLERWLGVEAVEHLSASMKDWYGPPIAVAGVPGRVYVTKGGDYRGRIYSGRFATGMCAAEKLKRRLRANLRDIARGSQLNVGFSSFSDLIAARSAGQNRFFDYTKAGATGVVGGTNSLWGLGAMPAAGANASNAPGGDAPTDATTGAFGYTNPGGTDTLHLTLAQVLADRTGTLLLYDRLFQVNKTMNSTANEAVTGTLTRYTSTTGGAADSAEGNFMFVEVGGTQLAATGHNWDTCLYTDQSGNTGAALPTITGNSAAIVRRLDHPLQNWFAPLASGDTGVLALTQMHCSAAVATGVINFVIGHPIAQIPVPILNVLCTFDGVNTAFNLVRIFDDAALAFLELNKPATTATNYNIHLEASFS